MIRELRRKFILILMAIATLILLAIFIAMLVSSWAGSRRMTQNILQQALAAPPAPFLPPPANGSDKLEPMRDMPPRSRMPVLLVEIGPTGEILFLSNQFHFITEDEATTLVKNILDTDKNAGEIRKYGLRWLKAEDGTRIAIADVSIEYEMLNSLVFNSLFIGAGALTIFFFLSLLLARWAVRPVKTAWEKQQQFVADASHELKTPLTVILSNADMLNTEQSFTNDNAARRAGHIQAEAVRMKKLIEDLLTLARTDTGGKLHTEPVDVSFIANAVTLAYEPIIFDADKRLHYSIAGNITLLGNPGQIQQLIHILLDNAEKYCPPQGEISVTLAGTAKNTALLTVYNDGEPIPAKELKQIFQRFYRVDEARCAHGSFGLGLSIAEGIVLRHKGKIWAENVARQGNKFCVQLHTM